MGQKRICILPRMNGVGGMVSFRGRLVRGLAKLGLLVSDDLDDHPYEAVLVIGGTRQIVGLWRAKRRGVRIVQRLNGMNWVHRLRRTGVRHYLRAEYGNLLLALIRTQLAEHVIYQSEFARNWWDSVRGSTSANTSVTYNGVDLGEFTPAGSHSRPQGHYRVLLVEGSLMGGYEVGLEVAVSLVERLNTAHSRQLNKHVELMVVGRVSAGVRERWQNLSSTSINWGGLVPGDDIPHLDRSAHLLYSADVNPACPNSVVEALACGLPVLAFDTGALPEMVNGNAGEVVAYGGDPWRLDHPDVKSLSSAAVEILLEGERYRVGARNRAEAVFSLDEMTERYLQALLES